MPIANVVAGQVIASGTFGNPVVNAVNQAVDTDIPALQSGKVAKAGDTMAGDLGMGANKVTSSAAPATDDTLTRKGYVDTADALKVNKAGDTMSGDLAMVNARVTGLLDPALAQDAATKAYVDAQIPLVGQASTVMAGALSEGVAAVASGTTFYVSLWQYSGAVSGIEADFLRRMVAVGSARTFRVKRISCQRLGSTQVLTCTLRKNGIDTTGTFAIANGSKVSGGLAFSPAVDFVDGDSLSIKCVTSGGGSISVSGLFFTIDVEVF